MKLFKRVPDDSPEYADASWYVRFMVRGVRHLWSTKTSDRRTALARARHHKDAIVAEKYHLVDSQKTGNSLPQFKTVITQYKAMAPALGLPPATVAKNVRSLTLMMAASRITGTDTIDKLGRGLAIKWQTERTAAGAPPTTINSRHRAARSVFSNDALLRYDPALPRQYIDDFRSVPLMREDEHQRPIPDDAAMALAHAKLAAHPQHYRAFLLGAYAGLRSGEIIAAEWSWLDADVLTVGGRGFTTKSGKWRAIRLAADVLVKLGPRGEGSIVGDGAKTITQRGLPSMLRALGFTAPDPVHSLRRWFGSQLATTGGIYAAQQALGHSTVAVTERSYARLLRLPDAVPVAPASSLAAPNPHQPASAGAPAGHGGSPQAGTSAPIPQ